MYSLGRRTLPVARTKRLLWTLVISMCLVTSQIHATNRPFTNDPLASQLYDFVGAETTDHVMALIDDSRQDLEISFRKTPKREEAFFSLINDCIGLLDGLDFVPPACNILFGTFPEVDRVVDYLLQTKLSKDQATPWIPREFNDILNGMICGLCPTATCEIRICESF